MPDSPGQISEQGFEELMNTLAHLENLAKEYGVYGLIDHVIELRHELIQLHYKGKGRLATPLTVQAIRMRTRLI